MTRRITEDTPVPSYPHYQVVVVKGMDVKLFTFDFAEDVTEWISKNGYILKDKDQYWIASASIQYVHPSKISDNIIPFEMPAPDDHAP